MLIGQVPFSLRSVNASTFKQHCKPV
uniref:Uncharacterized protein n=1 Tax=Arundo donax TaxID=35708 RepID=A0A0A9BSI3_ARUDO